MTLWIVVSIFHYTLTNNIVTSFVFLLMLNDFNFEDFNLLILQISMIALFFLSYGEFALLSITRHELYYYLLTKFYFLSIENTSKKYEKLKHLAKGLNYYRRFI